MRTLFLILISFISACVFGQVNTNVQQPKTEIFTPVIQNKSYTKPNNVKSEKTSTNYQSQLQGKKADELVKYSTSNNPQVIYESLNKNNYLLTSNNTIPNKSYSSIKTVATILNEVQINESRINYKLPSNQNKVGVNHFIQAYNELLSMLEGKTPLNLKKAVFLTENAFFNNTMNYIDFKKSIQEMSYLIQAKMIQSNLSLKSNRNINYMVYKYMADTLQIKLPSKEKTLTTYPKTYDFKDPFGYEDPTKLFVSKLIVENNGQCKSLPLLYLILLEELKGKAYLSFSPSHSYIQYKENNTFYNVELTNGMLSSDSWLLASGYVKAETVKSGIYLDTLNTKKVIANCLTDLAQYYSYHYGGYDDFVLKCANTTLQYHSSNINAIQVKSDYYSLLFQHITKQRNYTSDAQLQKDAQAYNIFTQRNKIYALLDGVGYENMPTEVYKKWLTTLEEKAEQQKHQVNIKQFSMPIK